MKATTPAQPPIKRTAWTWTFPVFCEALARAGFRPEPWLGGVLAAWMNDGPRCSASFRIVDATRRMRSAVRRQAWGAPSATGLEICGKDKMTSTYFGAIGWKML